MNFYEHHLGDYMRDTAHLSMIEDAAYRRLLDAYYIREAPLPADLRDCCKLARAHSKVERDAVAYVLREFFDLRDDGHHQDRADREIARYQARRREVAAFWKALPSSTKLEIAKARRAALVNATPDWLTEQDKDAIEAVYAVARAMSLGSGVPHQVDHIIPLRGKDVCGLHVPWNLRAITAAENRRKGRAVQ